MEADIRWRQRFDNFDRAFGLLREVLERGWDSLSPLEQEAATGRFMMAYELAWKTLKDLLEHDGISLDVVTPRTVIKEAYAAGLLDDGQVWIDMMLHRNQLSHTYDAQKFREALRAVDERYYHALERLHAMFRSRLGES